MIESDFVVRRAASGDMAVVGRLGELLVRLHHEFDPDRFLADDRPLAGTYARFLEAERQRDDVAVFVAERGQDIVGYVYAAVEGRSWKELRDVAGFIHDVVVDEQVRGRGVATALVDAAIAWLSERQVPRVMLWTAPQNEPAQRLFAGLGFRRTMIEMTREPLGSEKPPDGVATGRA